MDTLCLSSLLVFSLLFTSSSADDDSATMATLAAALYPMPTTWSTNSSSSDYCQWNGVSCDRYKRVFMIYLEAMSLSGPLPSEFPSLPGLKVLYLSRNCLSGSLPSLAKLTLLQELHLERNKFTSITPRFFQELPRTLQVLILNNNPYLAPWMIPTELAGLTSLIAFSAYNANIVGTIPDIFDSFLVSNLSLSSNNLTGSLPASLGRSQISNLWLHDQKVGFYGPIDVLSNMSYLVRAMLHANKLTGAIPNLSNCKYLENLQLHANQLTGVVPQSLVTHPTLKFVSLRNNKLQGPLPLFLHTKINASLGNNSFCTDTGDPCDPQVTALLEIAAALVYPLELSDSWTGNDACENWLFVTCSIQKKVIKIDLGKQHFRGTISPAFANLTALQYLYLNENNLTGSIRPSLASLPHLQLLDGSNNNLSGFIPLFASTVKLNIMGNPLLLADTSVYPSTGNKPAYSSKGNEGKMKIIIIVATTGIILGAPCLIFLGKGIRKHAGRSKVFHIKEKDSRFLPHNVNGQEEKQFKLQELQLLDFEKLATATNNFNPDNKLGQGGFGPVYKGKLQHGQQIAVKRLSRASGQGLEEFMNEVVVISKLQHRNLVRLLGCCVEKEEKMLVYEYMPNKSLDVFLFDPQKERVLEWKKRFSIIEGISRGVLYLHRDSRLRIIHRDLKASNILLDEELNPKISDFGMARIFGGNEDHVNTKRTYGYMSPEYAMRGQFSEKSDVFSFGVLVLEIVSGRRNTSFHNDEHSASLLEHAWKLWNDDNISALIDPGIFHSCSHREILRCIHVGLLCVQDFVKDRPNMSTVVSMLNSEIENFPTPKQPAFTVLETTISHSQLNQKGYSINNITITIPEGR